MIIAATVVMWMAALSRVVLSIRRPDPARISLTIALLFVASGLALHPGVLGGTFDLALHWPYGSELVQHLLWAAAVYFTLRFHMLLRRGCIASRIERIHFIVLVACLMAMLVLFWCIPVDPQAPTPVATPFVVEFAAEPAAVGYRAVFEVYLIYCLSALTALSLRNLTRRSTDPATISTSVSLAFIGAATAVGWPLTGSPARTRLGSSRSTRSPSRWPRSYWAWAWFFPFPSRDSCDGGRPLGPADTSMICGRPSAAPYLTS
jgi:hypothetical protein